MAAAARKPKLIETSAGVTVRHHRLVALVRAAGAAGDCLPTAELIRRGVKPAPKIVKPPTGPLRPPMGESVAPRGTGGRGRLCRVSRVNEHRQPGSDALTPRQQDVFLTWGDPAQTSPCRCVYDRAHAFRDGSRFCCAAVKGPGRPGSGGVSARRDSLARRYPPALLNGAGLSIDAQMDAQHEREVLLADWGVDGYGVRERDEDGRTGFRVYERRFGVARDKGSPRTALDGQLQAMIRRDGLSMSMNGIAARGVAVEEHAG